jgi:enterochelin esterase-like enzyme
MTTAFLRLLGFAFLVQAGVPAVAQTTEPVEDFKRSSVNQAGRQYPQVNSERRVRFRIVAPQAHSVWVNYGVKAKAGKGDDGAWVVTTPPLDEGFHYYSINIDGAEVPDPGTLFFFGFDRWGSAVEVPAQDQDFYALKNVPHGQLRQDLYFSKSANAVRRCFVYTPPGYDEDRTTRYPVLYLQHGAGENETGWGSQGRAGLIMDNLIADGKAKPFIIVMDNGGGLGGIASKFGAFERILMDDLIPHIDSSYRTLADQPHRALAGLSMGGIQTRLFASAHLDTFSYVGVFSGGSIAPSDIKDMGEFKGKIKLVFVSYGSREVDAASRKAAIFGDDPKANTDALTGAGINAHYFVSEQTAHEWQSGRRSLREFAPLLFQK